MPSMNDYRSRVGSAPTTPQKAETSTSLAAPQRTFQQLVEGVGASVDTRLSLLNRWKLKSNHQAMQVDVERVKLNSGKQLAIDWINREAQLMQADFQRSFAERFTAIAEAAMGAEMHAIQSLEAMNSAARRSVYVDLKVEFDRLQALLDKGVITEDDLRSEGALLVDRYDRMKQAFGALCDAYMAKVRRPFKNASEE